MVTCIDFHTSTKAALILPMGARETLLESEPAAPLKVSCNARPEVLAEDNMTLKTHSMLKIPPTVLDVSCFIMRVFTSPKLLHLLLLPRTAFPVPIVCSASGTNVNPGVPGQCLGAQVETVLCPAPCGRRRHTACGVMQTFLTPSVPNVQDGFTRA